MLSKYDKICLHFQSALSGNERFSSNVYKGKDDHRPHKEDRSSPTHQKIGEENKFLREQLEQSATEKNKMKDHIDSLTEQNKRNKPIIDDLSKLNQKYKAESEKLKSQMENLEKEKRELYMR